VCFGPASPDAGVELLRQLFLQCRGVGEEKDKYLFFEDLCFYSK
jgi:hypothetical protein